MSDRVVARRRESRVIDDDVSLLRSAAQGDHLAAERFYRRHADFVWSVVYPFCRDTDEAMDIAQDTFARVFLGAPFEERAAVRTWLFRVATRAALDFVRSARWRRHDALPDDVAITTPGADVDPLVRERIARAVAELPPPLADVFIACEVGGMSHDEVARLFDLSTGTSRRRLHDAKQRLRLALASVMMEWRA